MPRDGRRDPTKEEFWRRMVVGQARSRLSIRAWCRERDLPEHSFYWWRLRLAGRDAGRRRSRSRRPNPAFVPVRIAAASSAAESSPAEGWMEIILSGDCRVQVIGRVDREALADVLAVLTTGIHEARPC
jgi:hypothetical protein